jgi:dipeptidyl-peptidase-4
MKKFVSVITLLLTLSSISMAQEKKPFTLNDLIPGGSTYYKYVPKSLHDLKWEEESCVWTDSKDNKHSINPKTGKETVSAIDKKSEVKQKYDGDKSINGNIAYTKEQNLFINDTQITDVPKGVVCGQSVHRNEFGITKGTFWSPKGNFLAFYQMDESMVTQYPLVDATKRIAQVDYIRYPMAGMTSHKVSVGIYDMQSKKTIFLNTGDPTNRYFTNISWAPNEKSIYLIELNRDQNNARLCQYDIASGKLIKELLKEYHPKYVEPQHPIVFLPWDENLFIHQSQRSGFNHLYLYNTKGECIKAITSGNWLVQDILGFDKNKKDIIIASTEISPLQTNIYKVNIKSGKRTLIGDKIGVHKAMLSPSGRYVIDSYSAPTVPRKISIIDTYTNKEKVLLTAPDPYKNKEMPQIEIGTIKAADGITDLYYRLVKPVGFDETKHYPTIIYVYGGPHAQMINNGWLNGVRGWDIYMAQKGYVMFSLDNRGSSNRGLTFENVTFRHLGIEEAKDQMEGVAFLKSLPYVDSNRIGVHGWSFGGHMTVSLMLKHSDVFKVGVAGGPVIDWKYYEIMYGERYMDTPQDNSDGYKETDLKNYAGNLKGHLLIIHDDHDNTCVPQHTLSFTKACIDAGTYPDLFTYPMHEHNVIGKDRVHLHEKITRYFDDYLK